MSRPLIKIAVASDLHAISGASQSVSRSHLRVGDSEDYPGKQPIAGLLKLIKDEHLKANILLCPGDLGDQADPEGIRYAWNALHRIGEKLGCQTVVATTGNHDVDSKFLHHRFDPLEVLKELSPPYPLPDDSSNERYWMKHFVVWEGEQVRLVILNSSAFTATPGEQSHGRISEATLTKLRAYLASTEPKALNLLTCHHHPQQHSELKLGDYDWMREGQELLDLLGTRLYGSWMIIHGHKHHPKLTYASGGLSSPIVFSAGSLSAVLYPELGTAARNQFYLLEFTKQDLDRFGIVGRGRAWDWATSIGWVAASKGSGLPASFGFGCRQDLRTLSQAIAHEVGARRTAAWSTLSGAIPELKFLLPQDIEALNRQLRSDTTFSIFFDNDNVPNRLGKLPEQEA